MKQFGICSLEKRRLRGDMIEVYKILNEKKEWTKPNIFSLPWTHTDYEDTYRSCLSQDAERQLGSHLSPTEQSTNGTDCHSMSLIHHQSTSSRTVWMKLGKIWAPTAEKLPRSSTTSTSTSTSIAGLVFWLHGNALVAISTSYSTLRPVKLWVAAREFTVVVIISWNVHRTIFTSH